ncbi:porin [Pseudooceanicola aestuarii]|uniref:porin n=1 Tax=Pseudooceanicola aestuarii TaxID=2697319 RepID=UPI0013D7CC1F|nr:porin [Pseudooceanicola aestuarii]
MKKILFATTALIATAGMAAAEIKLSGYGRFGALYVEGGSPETRIESRFRVNIDGTTTADNGLTFGARVRMQADDSSFDGQGSAGAAGLSGARFYAMAGGLTVGVGNILGAIDSMPNLYTGSIGLSGLGYANVVSSFGADDFQSTGTGRNGVEVIYDGGQFGGHISYSNSDADGTVNGVTLERTAGHVSATFNTITVALGFQDSNVATDTEWALTVGGKIGMGTVALAYADNGTAGDKFTLSGDFEVGSATSVQAYYTNDEAQVDEDAFGIGFKHDLGGGASLRGGVAETHGTTRADMGVLFAF